MAPARIWDVLSRPALGIDPCWDVTWLTTREEEGDLALSEWVRLRFHLAGCHDCSEYRRQFQLTVHALGRLPAPNISAVTKRFLLRQFQARQNS